MAKIAINKVSEEPEKEYIRAARKMLLGKKRPPLFTRVILMIALVAFCYYFFWNGLRVVAFSNVDMIDDPGEASKFKAYVEALGSKYDINRMLDTVINYGWSMMAAWGGVMLGMILIYRRKLFGYYIFFVSLLASMVVPFVFFGWDYSTNFEEGVDYWDFIIPPVLIAIFYFSFRRLKKLKEQAKLDELK